MTFVIHVETFPSDDIRFEVYKVSPVGYRVLHETLRVSIVTHRQSAGIRRDCFCLCYGFDKVFVDSTLSASRSSSAFF